MKLNEKVIAILEGKETYKEGESRLAQAAMWHSEEHGVSLDEARQAIEEELLDTDVDVELVGIFNQVIEQVSNTVESPAVNFMAAFEEALRRLGVEAVDHVVTFFDLTVDENLTPVKATFYAEKVALMVQELQRSPAYRNATPLVRKHLMTGLNFKYAV